MTASESAYAVDFSVSLDGYANTRPRTMQRELGISDIGKCREQARRIIADVPHSDSTSLRAAEMGTAVHDFLTAARRWAHPRLVFDLRLQVAMPCGLTVPGTADEIDPDEPAVTDWKTVASRAELAYIQRVGSKIEQRFQRHLCYYGAYQAGLVPLEGTVRNIWIPRAGDTDEVVVEQEQFSMDVVHQADDWINDVLYAARYNEEAPRDPSVVWCQRFCPWYTDCRGEATEGIQITDPDLVEAAEIYVTAHASSTENDLVAKGARDKLLIMAARDPRWFIQLEDGRRLAFSYVHTTPPSWRLNIR